MVGLGGDIELAMPALNARLSHAAHGEGESLILQQKTQLLFDGLGRLHLRTLIDHERFFAVAVGGLDRLHAMRRRRSGGTVPFDE